MGLIRAAMGAAGGVMADQWKEYFYCEAMPADLLATRGWKRQSGRSANTKGNDNIISNGSIVAVADGQCAMIVEQGKVVDMCAEPGEYTYDTGSAPTLFSGDLSESMPFVSWPTTFICSASGKPTIHPKHRRKIPIPDSWKQSRKRTMWAICWIFSWRIPPMNKSCGLPNIN